MNSEDILLEVHPIIARPPAWASINDAATGTPVGKPNSSAALGVNLPHNSPGLITFEPKS